MKDKGDVKMKRKSMAAILCIVLAFTLGVFGMTGCNDGEKDILVISRDATSGTRDAFDGLIKKDGASLKKDANGNDYTASPIVKSAEFLSKTGDVITKVSATKTAMGYISLGSLDNTVKALSIGGVAATSENVLNGTYSLKRPFVVVTSNSVELTAATADFMNYLKSSDAQEIVVEDYVEQASTVSYTAPDQALSGKIIIRGSSSMDALMDKLIQDYLSIGGAKVSEIEFDKDAQGSSFGTSAAKTDTVGNVIGMSSSSIKSADAPSLNQYTIALDAVVVIVNNSNTLANITIEQLFDVYTGNITKFSQLSE